MKTKKILTILLTLLILPTAFAQTFENSLLDINYLTYTFLENSKFNHFNEEGPEILVNKAKPIVGDEVRIVLTDNDAKKNIEITLLSETEQKKMIINELENTGMFFEKIKITENYEENLTFPFSTKKLLIFYKTTKPYVYQFGEEELKAEQKKQEETKKIKKQEEQKQESQEQQINCDYYRSDELEGSSDYIFIESTDPCEDLITTYKDQLFNKAKLVAQKECDKISCVRTACNCQQTFQEFPYEENRMQCMFITGRAQTRLSYTIEGACLCKC